MKKLSERTDEEMRKRLAMTSDEYNEEVAPVKKEVQANPERKPTVPGGAPGPKTPEEIQKNPKDAINPSAVEDMGAKHEMSFDPKKGKEWWDSVTNGKTHKITACMEAAKDFADSPGAFCKALAEDVGYDPNA